MRKSLMYPKVLHPLAGISLLLIFPVPAQGFSQCRQTLAQDAFIANRSPSRATKIGWSGATAISSICQPDPTCRSQLNDVAVNASGLTVAAWDQFTYATGGPYTVGLAIQSGGRDTAFSSFQEVLGLVPAQAM